jgi:IMP dehydrogenase
MGSDATVAEYMDRDVETVSPNDAVRSVARRVAASEPHSGLPVCDGRTLVGFVTAEDLLLAAPDARLFTLLDEEVTAVRPDTPVSDAGRVLLREGVRDLPVVRGGGALAGVVSNVDVLRSHIERATPEKARRLTRTLERVHGVEVDTDRRPVALDRLLPTQPTVCAGELEGRQYELRCGLAEPIVVVDDGQLILADGHHRVRAARELDIDRLDAYLLVVDRSIDLGLRRTARREGLESIDDVEVVDEACRPLGVRLEMP